jgi:hypothetical protein
MRGRQQARGALTEEQKPGLEPGFSAFHVAAGAGVGVSVGMARWANG